MRKRVLMACLVLALVSDRTLHAGDARIYSNRRDIAVLKEQAETVSEKTARLDKEIVALRKELDTLKREIAEIRKLLKSLLMGTMRAGDDEADSSCTAVSPGPAATGHNPASDTDGNDEAAPREKAE